MPHYRNNFCVKAVFVNLDLPSILDIQHRISR
jgi:hypothetical protein